VPPPAARADYALTEAGRALLPGIGALAQWGLTHLPPPEPGEVVSPTLGILAERYGLST
jgi:DNA-binding HxlR family transcriptional regulator